MKTCKYCGAQNRDSASVCDRCGANEFTYICNNCGTVFDSGLYCPRCGVKVGARSKTCPQCGCQYYSKACPDCGYVPAIRSTPPPSAEKGRANMTRPVRKKKRILLWILGWIFIFPVPLTILMVRSQRASKLIKIIVIAAAWLIYLGMGKSGGSNGISKENTLPKITQTPAPITVSTSEPVSSPIPSIEPKQDIQPIQVLETVEVLDIIAPTPVAQIELEETAPEAASQIEESTESVITNERYIVNTDTKKFHNPSCFTAAVMDETKKWDYEGTRDWLIENGYLPCKNCNP